MSKGPPPPLIRWSASLLIPLAVLVFGLLLSLWVWAQERQDQAAQTRRSFDRLEERLLTSVQARFEAMAVALEHGRTLCVLKECSPEDWARYYDGVGAQAPRGLVGLGYVQALERAKLPALESSLKAAYGDEVFVEAGGRGPRAYVVTRIEPLAQNRLALGKDLTTGKTRRSAAEAAMLSGGLVTSSRIQVVWKDQTLPGFLAFLPVYEESVPLHSPEQREAALRGWVYASIQAAALLDDLDVSLGGQLDYEFFEGDSMETARLLFDQDGHLGKAEGGFADLALYRGRSFVSRNELQLLGRTWHLVVSSNEAFDRAVAQSQATQVLIAGLLLSLLLAALVWSLMNARDRARAEALRMTEDLRGSEARSRRLALIAARTEQGVVIGSVEGGLTWVNAGFCRITGYSASEVLGKLLTDLLGGPETDMAEAVKFRDAIVSGQAHTAEVHCHGKGGRSFWARIETRPLEDVDDATHSHMTIITDVSERVAAGHVLMRAKEEADAANRAKSAFLAVMSHEIRTPLNGIIGMTSVLADTELSDEQQEFLRIVRSSGDTLLHLINDILDFSKIESGRMELECIPVSPRAILGEVIDLFGHKASEKGLELVCEVDPSVPMVVRSDPVRLKQILVNLVGNALKFTEHGEIALRLGSQVLPDGGFRLNFSIRDTGVGISEEAQSRLFQSFTQADASTTRRYGGTGLGLAISKRLAEYLGGGLWCESRLGEGSCFHLQISVAELGRLSSPPEFDAQSLAGYTVLIADVNRTHAQVLEGQLSRHGAQVRHLYEPVNLLAEARALGPASVLIVDARLLPYSATALMERLERGSLSRPPLLVVLCPVVHGRTPQPPHPKVLLVPKPGHPGQILQLLQEHLAPGGRPLPSLSSPPQATPAMPSAAARLVLVEDDPVNCRVAELLLARLGFSVRVLMDSLAAVPVLESGEGDIVLLDVQMPGMSGLELASHLREHYRADPSQKPWLIAVTANVMPEDRKACAQAGMDDFIPKPIRDDELAAALGRGLEALKLRRRQSRQ